MLKKTWWPGKKRQKNRGGNQHFKDTNIITNISAAKALLCFESCLGRLGGHAISVQTYDCPSSLQWQKLQSFLNTFPCSHTSSWSFVSVIKHFKISSKHFNTL
jgi:hypothetical protein